MNPRDNHARGLGLCAESNGRRTDREVQSPYEALDSHALAPSSVASPEATAHGDSSIGPLV